MSLSEEQRPDRATLGEPGDDGDRDGSDAWTSQAAARISSEQRSHQGRCGPADTLVSGFQLLKLGGSKCVVFSPQVCGLYGSPRARIHRTAGHPLTFAETPRRSGQGLGKPGGEKKGRLRCAPFGSCWCEEAGGRLTGSWAWDVTGRGHICLSLLSP